MTSGMKTATSMELFCVCARKNGVSFSAKTNELGGMLVQRSGEIISQFLFNSGLKAIRDHFSIRAGSMKRFDQLQSLESFYMTVLYIEFILFLFLHFSHFYFLFSKFLSLAFYNSFFFFFFRIFLMLFLTISCLFLCFLFFCFLFIIFFLFSFCAAVSFIL